MLLKEEMNDRELAFNKAHFFALAVLFMLRRKTSCLFNDQQLLIILYFVGYKKMTICVSVKVSEGLILAADSTASIPGAWSDSSGKTSNGILKTYEHVRKLSHVKDYPIGTLTWGVALLGSRSVESLIKEFEYSLPSLEEENEKIKRKRIDGDNNNEKPYKYCVKDIANSILNHIKNYCETESIYPSNPNQLGILVSGYSSGKFFPEQWMLDFSFLPESHEVKTELKAIRPDENGKPAFGADWFGLTDAIVRLHWGRDNQALTILADHFKVSQEEIHQLLSRMQYAVIFDGMPLQDAIDYSVYLINIVIGRFRFVVGAPLCGGEIDLAVITPNNFSWIHRKSWKIKTSLAK